MREAIEKFCKILETRRNEHIKKLAPESYELQKSSVSPNYGKKYAKIEVRTGPQCSVSAFVDLSTGDIFKSASWRAPAKGKRGNVFSNQNGAEALSPDGYIIYFR
jgi:hypothetical protein